MDIDFFSLAVWLARDGVPVPFDGTTEDDDTEFCISDAGFDEDRVLIPDNVC